MIEAFIASWPLFHTTYLAGAAIAGLLALVGVFVVARDQLFVGAAMSQASTLGIAVCLWLGSAAAGVAPAVAVAASVATALACVRASRADGASAESRTAWIFLASASIPVLLLAHSPHGLEEVHRLMFSTLLGATDADVARIAALGVATALVVARWHAPLRLFAIDPEMAAAVGVPVGAVAAIVAIVLGVAVGVSIEVAGLIYTFGCLVLPALAARRLVRGMAPLLWLAPLLAIAVAAAAFVVANHFDLPPAHATVTGLALLVAATWLRRAR